MNFDVRALNGGSSILSLDDQQLALYYIRLQYQNSVTAQSSEYEIQKGAFLGITVNQN